MAKALKAGAEIGVLYYMMDDQRALTDTSGWIPRTVSGVQELGSGIISVNGEELVKERIRSLRAGKLPLNREDDEERFRKVGVKTYAMEQQPAHFPLHAPCPRRGGVGMTIPRLTIVPAGAGSGKTHRIQTCLAEWVIGGLVAPDRIIAVAFTDAASAPTSGTACFAPMVLKVQTSATLSRPYFVRTYSMISLSPLNLRTSVVSQGGSSAASFGLTLSAPGIEIPADCTPGA